MLKSIMIIMKYIYNGANFKIGEKMRGILSKSILSIVILVLFFNTTVKADSIAAPTSYKKEVGNGKYVFVMLTTESNKIMSKTNKEYSKSGLYENDGSVTPIWTVDWYQYEGLIFITDDGDHIASLGPWATLSNSDKMDLNQLAISFYNKGSLVKQYYISDLVKNTSNISRSASHFEWRDNVEFDSNASTFTVTTKDKNEYVFDVKNGNIIKKNIKWISLNHIIFIFIVGASGLMIVFKRMRRKKSLG